MSGTSSKNISNQAGLPLTYRNGELQAGAGVVGGKKSVRRVRDLNPVLFESAGRRTDDERAVYYVWRDLKQKKDAEEIAHRKIRYDITALTSEPIGREPPKTFGHYHAKDISGVTFPEVYAVLSGMAWWIIQRPKKNDPRTIEEAYLVEAHEGEKAVMPPGFGHITINPGSVPLILSNWIGDFFQYDYDTYENLHGACYWALETDGAVAFEKNSFYYTVPDLTKLQPREIPQLGIMKKKPLYSIIEHPEHLDFLLHPKPYLSRLTVEACFRKV